MSRKRLKPIFDILEAGNNKKVIQEIDKLLTKTTPTSNKKDVDDDEELTIVIAKALKSLALVRLGRLEEGDKLFNELLSKNIIEDNALSIMMQYCRETQQISKIVSFYENAVKKEPNNEDLLTSLFYAYARTQEFNKQQQTALKLYRLTNKIIYCFWQALSYVIMCEDNDLLATQLTPQQKQLNLQLAERIFEKAYAENKIEPNGGEYVFYLNFLEKRGHFKKSFDLIENLDEKKIGIINYKIKNEINLLNKLNENEKCKVKLEEYLERESDDWSYLKHYLELCLNKLNLDKKVVIEFLNRLKKPTSKGPYLAILDLYQLTCEASAADVNEIKENFKQLIELFHYKPGFYYDLIYFDKLINKFDLKIFILTLIENYLAKNLEFELVNADCLNIDKLKIINKFKTIDHLYSFISYWQLYRHFDLHLNLTQIEVISIIRQLNDAYENGLDFGKELLDTTQQFSDEIFMLKINFKYDLIRFLENIKQKSKLLLNIIADVNYALTRSKSNYQLKLYLVNLYSNLSLYNQLEKNFNLMDIKNIQYYSMSYLVLYNCLRLGSYEQSNDVLSLIKQFYTTNLFDITNYMINCYKYGTFDKLFDLYKFMINIRKSLNLNVCLQEKFLLKNLFGSNDATVAAVAGAASASAVSGATFLQANAASVELLAKQFDIYFHDLEHNACLNDQLDFNLQLNDNNLIDHNDRTVLQYWLSEAQNQLQVRNDYNDLINEQRNLLVYRNFYLKFLHLALKSSLGQLSDAKQFDILIGNLEKFELNLKFADLSTNDFKATKPVNELLNPKSSYLQILLKNKFNQVNSALLRGLYIKIFQQKENFFSNELKIEENKNLNFALNELKSFFEAYKLHLDATSASNNDLLALNSYYIEYFAVVCECLSLHAYLFILVVFNQLPYWQEKCSKKKSSKKKKQFYLDYQTSVDLMFEIYEQYCSIYQFSIEFISRLAKNLNEHQASSTANSDELLDDILSNNNDYSLSNDLKESYSSAYQQLLNQFEFKHKQLQQLISN